MNIEQSQVVKLKLTDVDGLDPITVILEDLGKHKGKIIIECYGKSWSSYWGAMGSSLAEFFVSCNECYLADNLARLDHEVVDDEATESMIKSKIINCRRNGNINSFEARTLFDDASFDMVKDGHPLVRSSICELLFDGFSDWWNIGLPKKPNPDYVYLCKIIRAVQVALKSLEHPVAV